MTQTQQEQDCLDPTHPVVEKKAKKRPGTYGVSVRNIEAKQLSGEMQAVRDRHVASLEALSDPEEILATARTIIHCHVGVIASFTRDCVFPLVVRHFDFKGWTRARFADYLHQRLDASKRTVQGWLSDICNEESPRHNPELAALLPPPDARGGPRTRKEERGAERHGREFCAELRANDRLSLEAAWSKPTPEERAKLRLPTPKRKPHNRAVQQAIDTVHQTIQEGPFDPAELDSIRSQLDLLRAELLERAEEARLVANCAAPVDL